MAMVWQAVESTQIERIGYDEDTEIAMVDFVSGATYEYDTVPKDVVDQIVNSPSPGRTFAATLKRGYPYRRIV